MSRADRRAERRRARGTRGPRSTSGGRARPVGHSGSGIRRQQRVAIILLAALALVALAVVASPVISTPPGR